MISKLLSTEWIVLPVAGILIFVFSYLWVDKILGWLAKKSLGSREEVMRYLDLMFVPIDKKRITYTMLLGSFGLGFLFFLLLWPNMIFGTILGAVVMIGGWSIPLVVVKYLYDRRCSKFVDQMVDGLNMMSNGIRAGLSVSQTIERVSENMHNPIKQEFNLVLSEMRLGLSVEEALNNLGERIPKPDVQMFVTAINILKETGGNLGETFETISHTIRERQKIEKKIEALTAQGIMQGIIITLVPFVLMIIFALIDPNYIAPLFNTTFGLIILFIMIGLQIMGGYMIRKIVTIKV